MRLAGGQFDHATPVLILKTQAQPLHHGTLGAIRSLGRAGLEIYASREPQAAPAARSRYLRAEAFGILSPSDPATGVAALAAFRMRLGRPVVVLAVDDNGALFLAENAGALRDGFLAPRQRPELLRAVASKANFPRLCAMAGAATPDSIVVKAGDDLAATAACVRYPAVAKIAQPWLLPPDLPPVVFARGPGDLAGYRSRLRVEPSADIVVQEYIPDGQAEDWFYHGYHREDGEAVVGFTGRKLRSHPPFFGATTYGVSIVNPDVLAISQHILRTLGYAGVVELEYRLDRRDGRYKLIDFNPRLGAQFQFLRNQVGIDVVRAMHLDLTGREVPAAPQAAGRTFVSDFTDLAAFPAYRRQGAVTVGTWLRQVVGADEHAWFAADDVAPFLAAAGYLARRLVATGRKNVGIRGSPRVRLGDDLDVCRQP